MTRNRQSAKKAGTSFETDLAAHLSTHIDDRIERRRLSGSKDRGDIAALRSPHGAHVVVECKNVARISLATWAAEAETARGNADALIAFVAHKRHGVGYIGKQWITMTVDDLIAIFTGSRPDVTE